MYDTADAADCDRTDLNTKIYVNQSLRVSDRALCIPGNLDESRADNLRDFLGLFFGSQKISAIPRRHLRVTLTGIIAARVERSPVGHGGESVEVLQLHDARGSASFDDGAARLDGDAGTNHHQRHSQAEQIKR